LGAKARYNCLKISQRAELPFAGSKPFGRRPVDWFNTQQSNNFIEELSKVRILTLTDLVQVTKGGSNPGTIRCKKSYTDRISKS
jgi:hypothetical protein